MANENNVRPLNIDIAATFNTVIQFVNKVGPDVSDEVIRPMTVIDTKFEIILANLEKVGNRAIALGDEELVKYLMALGVIRAEPETKDQVAESSKTPVK